MRRLVPITAMLALISLSFGGSAENTVQVTAAFSPIDDSQSEFCGGFTDTLNLEFAEDGTGTIGWLGGAEPLPFIVTGGVLAAELVTPVEEDPGTVTREVFEIDLVTGEITVAFLVIPTEAGLSCTHTATTSLEQLEQILALIAEALQTPTTTTTESATDIEDTENTTAESATSSAPVGTTTITVPGSSDADRGFPWMVLILIGSGLLMFGAAWWWWAVFRVPGYGKALVDLLISLNTPPPEEPPDDSGTTTETTETTTVADDGQTRDDTVIFGPRNRPRKDCKPLVDACERLRAEATRLEEHAKRQRKWAERARKLCERARQQLKDAQKHYDDLKPDKNAPMYYERMAGAGTDLTNAKADVRKFCPKAKQEEAAAAKAEADASAARARAEAACAKAKECLDKKPKSEPGKPAPSVAPSSAPPPAAQSGSVSEKPPQNRCGPEVGQGFLDCMNRVLDRLDVLFDRDSGRATGYSFLVSNGGAMDFWIIGELLGPPCNCPGMRCLNTVTLFEVCYPHHVMSDFMFGFCAGWFGLSDFEIVWGSRGWKTLKLVGKGFRGRFATPAWDTASKPAYAGGAKAAREIRAQKNEKVRKHHIVDGLAKVAKRGDCEPCPCKSKVTPKPDFSVEKWDWPEPIDVTRRWAVTGKRPR